MGGKRRGQIGQISHMGQISQMGQIGQIGHMGQIGRIGQMGQMGHMGQMGQLTPKELKGSLIVMFLNLTSMTNTPKTFRYQ